MKEARDVRKMCALSPLSRHILDAVMMGWYATLFRGGGDEGSTAPSLRGASTQDRIYPWIRERLEVRRRTRGMGGKGAWIRVLSSNRDEEHGIARDVRGHLGLTE